MFTTFRTPASVVHSRGRCLAHPLEHSVRALLASQYLALLLGNSGVQCVPVLLDELLNQPCCGIVLGPVTLLKSALTRYFHNCKVCAHKGLPLHHKYVKRMWRHLAEQLLKGNLQVNLGNAS